MNQLTPNMMVDDMPAAIAFYRDVLGFDLVMTVPQAEPFDWALLRRADVQVMFQTRASLEAEVPYLAGRALGGALTLYIDTEDVSGLYERVRPKAEIIHEVATTFYGKREFSLRDPNGFVLTFAEDAR